MLSALLHLPPPQSFLQKTCRSAEVLQTCAGSNWNPSTALPHNRTQCLLTYPPVQVLQTCACNLVPGGPDASPSALQVDVGEAERGQGTSAAERRQRAQGPAAGDGTTRYGQCAERQAESTETKKCTRTGHTTKARQLVAPAFQTQFFVFWFISGLKDVKGVKATGTWNQEKQYILIGEGEESSTMTTMMTSDSERPKINYKTIVFFEIRALTS